MYERWKLPVFASCVVFGLPSIAFSAEIQPVKQQPTPVERFSESNVSFVLKGNVKGIHNVVLTVTGPNGYSATSFSKKEVPSLALQKYGKVGNGVYRYQITAASKETTEIASKLNNGRGKNSKIDINKGISLSGVFQVKDGQIVAKDDLKEKEQTNDKE